MKRYVSLVLAVILIFALSGVPLAASGGEAGHHGVDGSGLGLLWIFPFVGILLSIAIFPLVAPEFWHHHFGKVALFWAAVFAVPYLAIYHGKGFYDILHIYLLDYIPFIILLWALFTISGGILLSGSIKGTPRTNSLFLLIGTVLASWIGTTGASMVLIRPLIRANQFRKSKTHIVIFFIFLVSNIGGSLTPLGDPPLFLGFLHGVPFFWTTTTLFKPMAFISVILLIIFFVMDMYLYRKEEKEGFIGKPNEGEPVKLEGMHNFLFLLGVIGAVLLSGLWNPHKSFNVFGVHLELQNIVRDILMVVMGLLSLKLTSRDIRERNFFTWFPIVEVAKLFAGIFVTIVPCLLILKAGEHGALRSLVERVQEPVHFFWITGALSSFLDNAPTYLTFYTSALGKFGLMESHVAAELASPTGHFVLYLEAISIGAVFMGANTYIGNAPNFMVKSIAEENKIRMPSFFGYMLWSGCILIPLFFLVEFIFLQ